MTPRRPIRQSAARRAVMQMMGAVIVVHIIAITVWRLALQRQPERVVRLFGAAWTAVTLVIVLVGLYRVRVARQAARASRRT